MTTNNNPSFEIITSYDEILVKVTSVGNDLAKVKELLGQEPAIKNYIFKRVDWTAMKFSPPLHNAALNGYTELIKLLVNDYDFQVDAMDAGSKNNNITT